MCRRDTPLDLSQGATEQTGNPLMSHPGRWFLCGVDTCRRGALHAQRPMPASDASARLV